MTTDYARIFMPAQASEPLEYIGLAFIFDQFVMMAVGFAAAAKP
jgi:hypothetical protein